MLELTVRPPDPNRVHSQAVAPSGELGGGVSYNVEDLQFRIIRGI